MRRLAIALLLVPFAGLVGLSSAASAEDPVAEGLAPVDVLQVSGLFDEVTVKSVTDAIDRSETNGSQALVLQISSLGAVVDDEMMTMLLRRVESADVAIGLWVGPSRDSRLYGAPAQLMRVADITAMVAGSRVGHMGEFLPVDGAVTDLGDSTSTLQYSSMSFAEINRAGLLTKIATEGASSDDGVPTMRSMVLAMDGLEVGDSTLDTVTQVLDDQGESQNVATLVRFTGLGLVEELVHTVASPPMAFLFFVIGCCLLIFEFFTAGVGVAGFVGAVLTVLGCSGLAALPTRTGALALLIAAMIAFAVDVQVGIPRFWTGVGATLFTLGAWFLYEPLAGTDLRLSWLTLAVGIIGVLLTFIVGMPSMVRTRFATPTIGREWMIGKEGTAVGAIDPDGVAQVGEAKWRARTNRATPIAAGDVLRVSAIDGVTLEVEPIEGAARDYRERRPKGDTVTQSDEV